MFSCSSFALSSTWTAIGTSCRFSTRFCAVTTTSWRRPVVLRLRLGVAAGTAASSVGGNRQAGA